MTEPIRCSRCHRAFGGEQAYRRGHRRQGRPRRETCRRVAELRRSPYLRLDEAGVWHVRARTDPGQLMFALWGRGRPRDAMPIYMLGTRNRHTYRVRRRGRKAPLAERVDAEEAA